MFSITFKKDYTEFWLIFILLEFDPSSKPAVCILLSEVYSVNTQCGMSPEYLIHI